MAESNVDTILSIYYLLQLQQTPKTNYLMIKQNSKLIRKCTTQNSLPLFNYTVFLSQSRICKLGKKKIIFLSQKKLFVLCWLVESTMLTELRCWCFGYHTVVHYRSKYTLICWRWKRNVNIFRFSKWNVK